MMPSCHTLSNADCMSKKIAHILLDLLNASDVFCEGNRMLSVVAETRLVAYDDVIRFEVYFEECCNHAFEELCYAGSHADWPLVLDAVC